MSKLGRCSDGVSQAEGKDKEGEGLDVKAESPHTFEITEVKNFVRKDLPKPPEQK